MDKIALVGGRVVDPERKIPVAASLLVEQGRIVECLPAGDAPSDDWRRIDLAGRTLAPGFLDVHFHGELMTAPRSEFAAALGRARRRQLQTGVTTFLATTFAWSRQDLGPHVSALAEAIANEASGGATCLGLHLEGPWISPAAAGAMTVDCIRPFDAATDTDVLERAGDLLRLVTLAPEIDGAHALLDELGRRGAVAALGHSRASADEIAAGVDRGLRHVTHLFNAMGPFHHREPGVPGTVLARDDLTSDLICDGHHVHPDAVRIAARILRERLVLITDRVDFESPLDNGSDGAPLRLRDGTLAGSQLDLDGAVRNVQRFAGLDLHEAIAAATLRPAVMLGVENERGTLRPGTRADLVVLDAQGAVVETWLGGERAWQAQA